jgi:tetratricopeptide (TPR) repeat protein
MVPEQSMTHSSRSLLVAQFDKAVKLFVKEKYKEAIPKFYEVLQKKDMKEAWINLGLCYKELGNYPKAEQCLQKARITPYANGQVMLDDSVSMLNIGSIAYIHQEDEIARNYYGAAWNADKTNYEAAWNYGCTSIRMFCDGKPGINLLEAWFWQDHRFTLYDLYVQQKGIKLWDFTSRHPSEGVVVLRDQGRGDTLMFARYIPELEKYFERVYVQTDSTMESLFDRPYSDDSDCQYAVPMCSLGKLLDYIPPGDWLHEKRVVRVPDGKKRVGCVWNGSSVHPNDHNRSVDAVYFDKLTGIEKYTIGPNLTRPGYKHLVGDTWQDTIDNLNELDLLITVDTAIAHMAGCLGMPCWILMPRTYTDYRWGTEAGSGSETIWYDSMKVFRNHGSWEEMFKRIQDELDKS